MTTIAAFKDNNDVVAIAGDFAATGAIQVRHRPGKLTVLGGLVVGVAGIIPPPFKRRKYAPTPEGVQKFAEDYKKLLATQGHGAMTEDAIFVMPGEAVAIIPGHAPFWIGCTSAVIEPDCEYISIGSGSELAMGALFVARTLELDAEEALKTALLAAAEHDPNTSPQFSVLKLAPPVGKSRRVPQGGRRNPREAET